MPEPRLLVNTDVMIEYLRGADKVVAFLESLERRPATSVLCTAELLAGARDEEECNVIRQFLLAFDELAVDAEVARVGGEYRRIYMKSHNTGLADALIAATAAHHNLTLATFNVRHFPMLENVLVPYQRD
ncbi:MAG: type II toxin-antitoxin system VapC family toxin [Anaerolineae bacterium]